MVCRGLLGDPAQIVMPERHQRKSLPRMEAQVVTVAEDHVEPGPIVSDQSPPLLRTQIHRPRGMEVPAPHRLPGGPHLVHEREERVI